MKKVLKIGIFLFLTAVILSIVLILVLKSCDAKESKEKAPTFDRAALDEASPFKDFVFEERVRSFLNLPEGEIDTQALGNIKELDLSVPDIGIDDSHKISSLYGLKFFPQLTNLTINNGVYQDISPVSACGDLTSFTAKNCRFFSAEALSGLTNLTYIDLKNTRIQDSSFIKDLSRLEYLCLSQTEIAGVSVLAEAPFLNLRELYVDGTGVSDLAWIYNVVSLVRLDVSNNEILNEENLNGIEKLVNLEYFNGSSLSVSDVSVFTKLPKLKTLILSLNRIKDISSLTACTHLEELNVSSNMLTSIDCVKNIKGLKRFYAENNQITQFKALDGLNLEDVNVSGNLYLY